MTHDPDAVRADDFLEVRVPASTSNLGPGFDFLGLALSLQLQVRIVAAVKASVVPHRIDRAGGTAIDWPHTPDNLLFRAFDLATQRLSVARAAMHFEVDSEIPIARGLGSSGAAVAAGLLLASARAPRPASVDELLAWGLEMEGHPDNSTAALLGGCTLSVPRPEGGLCVVSQELHRDLGFALAWPDARLPTSEARGVLPAMVRFADAVENPRRLALLLEGLRRADPEMLRLGGEDRLHVAYRLPLIAGAATALRRACDAGAWLSTISGSGSALIAIGPHDRIHSIAVSMAEALCVDGRIAQSRVVEPVFGTPRVLDRKGQGRA